MGYTHYWYRKNGDLNADVFAKFSMDCEKVCRASEMPLAGGLGSGEPKFTADEVWFNGLENCGHIERDLGIAWPASKNSPDETTWFAGQMIERRECGGDCSHETFHIAQSMERETWQTEKEWHFACCKTAFKPYDVLVTACLIVYKHHFGDDVRVSSDGDSEHWEDARRLCQHVLGYGEDFQLPTE